MRILLVEDDRQLRSSLARGLREAGYDVLESGDGQEALELVRTRRPDCILLDILLPGLDGLEVCRSLRRGGDWTPILMLTALETVEQRIAGLDAGADDYLPKPFDFGELVARLHALIRRHVEHDTRVVRVADLVIDTRTRRVRRGGRDVELTAQEYRFLLYLARRAGRVVERSELIQRVWDGRQAHSNVIDVYASRLRRKLDEGAATPLLATHHGVGYALADPLLAVDAAPAPARRNDPTPER